MNKLLVLSVLSTIFLSACSWDPGGFKAQDKWLADKKSEEIAYKKKILEEQKERAEEQKQRETDFYKNHPEVLVPKIEVKSSTNEQLASAINSLDFVTRFPNDQTLDNVYVKVGGFPLTLRRFQLSIKQFADECQRVSAYNNADYKRLCAYSLTNGLQDFASVIKNPSIPDKTKSSALSEASYGSYIDFEHAAKLAQMHFKLCENNHNKGYVEMVTVAVPCDGKSDVLNIYAARKIGVI